MLRRSDTARVWKPNNGICCADDDDSKTSGHQEASVIAKKFLKIGLGVTTAALLLSVVAKLLPSDSIYRPVVQPNRNLGKKDLVSYHCPAITKGAVDAANNTHKVHDYQVQIHEQIKNFPRFLETFRKDGYDQHFYSWEHVKENNYNWKSRMYDLHDGDSVYESASGVGLNLFQTMEILQEAKGIESLVLYGNDYLDISVEMSNLLYDQAPPRGATKGQFCQSDSKNLSYVPSNSFDLVYTGYITPLFDPLGIQGQHSSNLLDFYKGLCKAKDLKSAKLLELAQARQDDHVGQWINEMIRIAKPGKAVIAELVSPHACEPNDLMGLVPRSFWKSAVHKFGWDIDPASIVIETNDLMHSRYNVFMRKNS